jgi:hypothetical protein
MFDMKRRELSRCSAARRHGRSRRTRSNRIICDASVS